MSNFLRWASGSLLVFGALAAVVIGFAFGEALSLSEGVRLALSAAAILAVTTALLFALRIGTCRTCGRSLFLSRDGDFFTPLPSLGGCPRCGTAFIGQSRSDPSQLDQSQIGATSIARALGRSLLLLLGLVMTLPALAFAALAVGGNEISMSATTGAIVAVALLVGVALILRAMVRR